MRLVSGILRKNRPDDPSCLVRAGNDNLVGVHASVMQSLHECRHVILTLFAIVERGAHAVDQQSSKICVPSFRYILHFETNLS